MLIKFKATTTSLSTAKRKLSLWTTSYLVLTTRTAGQIIMVKTHTTSTGNPQHALSAKVAMGPAKRLMATCLFTVMNSC